jgi:pimeloyl-ACP methyl ester carboxylesterase
VESQAIVQKSVVYRTGTGRPVVCVPGFTDSATSWRPLMSSLPELSYEVSVIELPGFGAAPAPAWTAGLSAYADELVRVVRSQWQEPVVLVGHSLGAVIAVRAAHLLGSSCSALVSLEGNMTTSDDYFSSRSAGFDDPAIFQRDFAETVDKMVHTGQAPLSYADAVRQADARSMWLHGRDASASGVNDAFGAEYRALAVPSLYVWAAGSTPPATQDYLRDHSVPNHRLDIEHHWPWQAAPDVVARVIASVFP